MSRREQNALLALFQSFSPSKKVTTFEQLSEGHVLMEFMNSIDETHFKVKSDPRPSAKGTSSSGSGDNWVLRMNMLKRLYRLLLSYPINRPNAPTLAVSSLPEPKFNAVARNPKSPEGMAGLVQICRFCVAVGAVGPANEIVIAKIQALDEGAMVELMKSIEQVMDSLPKGEDEDEDNAELSPLTTALRDERDSLRKANEELRAQCEEMTQQMAKLSANQETKREPDGVSEEERAGQQTTGPSEADNLRASLLRAEDGLAETEAALEKQTALVAELTKTVEELRKTALEVSQLRDQVEELRQVEDRLHKSENVIEKYKRKLEESAGLRRDLRSLEDEHAIVMQKNTELEAKLSKLERSKATADEYKAQDRLRQKTIDGHIAEIAQLTGQLEEAQNAFNNVEGELDTLREELQVQQARFHELEAGPDDGMSHIADQSLDMEMDSRSESSEAGPSRAEFVEASVNADSRLHGQIQALQEQLAAAQSAARAATQAQNTKTPSSNRQLPQKAESSRQGGQAEESTVDDGVKPDRARQDTKLPSEDGLQSQVSSLQKELTVAKHDSRTLESRYRLEHQLVLAAWHDLGARIVRDHVGVAGLRRPAITRPAATSWLARQRKNQDDALFTRWG